ncbi:MAG: hypothetical protein LBU12_03460 [Deltaproteobacteria bacterium]|jgi:hypothetical protein|nr:hypothetical protein [Deltaproteobacteria bacterium]
MSAEKLVVMRRPFPEPDRLKVQREVIAAVEGAPEFFLSRYDELPASFGGRFVNSDLFKLLFEVYAASKESRGRFNNVVHNASAALAARQFGRLAAGPAPTGRGVVYFLTGAPGSGKTTFVQRGGPGDLALPGDCRLLYEGQLAEGEAALEKAAQAVSVGEAAIFVMHRSAERCLLNTLRRFDEIGRGSSVEAIARIMGFLPAGLAKIRDRFGSDVSLTILDWRDGRRPVKLEGWRRLKALESEGDCEAIKARLLRLAQAERQAGRLSLAGLNQALGLSPPTGGLETDQAPGEAPEQTWAPASSPGPGATPCRRPPTRAEWLQAGLELGRRLEADEAARKALALRLF